MKGLFVLGFFALGIAMFLVLSRYGYVQPLQDKYASIINVFERLTTPAVASVQEHRPAAWGSTYYDLGIGILFIPVGFYFAAQNPTNRNIYLILFALTSIYFASAMVRLTLILAPVLCLLWALALTKVLKPFVTLLRETPVVFRRKTRFETHVGREFSAGFLILIFLLLTLTFVLPSTESRARGDPFPRVFDQSYVPTTIAAASMSVRPTEQAVPDWIDTLNWMRYNLPPDAVVISWWDYGYWITTIANKTSLADNGTLNSTQMKKIGEMFMSSETRTLEIVEDFNRQARTRGFSNKITHVLAFFTFDGNGNDYGAGEESKSRWMANIAFNNLTAWKGYGNYTLGKDGVDTNGDGQVDQLVDNAKGQSTTLYRLMMWGKSKRVSSITFQKPEDFPFELVYWSQKDKTSVVTVGGVNALVTVFRVVYP